MLANKMKSRRIITTICVTTISSNILLLLLLGRLAIVACGRGCGAKEEEPRRFPDRTTDPVRPFGDLEVVADLDFPPGNVAVTSSNEGKQPRIFISFHPDGFPPYGVAEIVNGTAEPYPTLHQSKQLFTSVLSLRIGPDDKTLWTLDHKLYGLAGRPRLLVLDIENNGQVIDEYIIPRHIAPILSFTNDFHFSPDGKRIVMADFSAIANKPALITLDVETRQFARKLQDHVSVQDAGFDVFVEGVPFKATGFFGVDPIAIAPSTSTSTDGTGDTTGGIVYYGPLNGLVLYSIPVDDLFGNDLLSEQQLAEKVQVVANKTMTDGIWYDNGLIYLSDMEHGAIVTLNVSSSSSSTTTNQNNKKNASTPDGLTLTTLFKDSRIRWPDGFSQGKNDSSGGGGGYIYFTCSDLNNVFFNVDYLLHYGKNNPYQVYRFLP